MPGSGADYVVDPTNAQAVTNEALSAVGAGGSVRVMAGEYTISSPILVGNRQSFVGDGSAQTVFTASGKFSGQALVRTPVGFRGTRVVLRDFAVNGLNKVANGVLVEANAKPDRYAPDPMPILNGIFVFQTAGDGFVLGGTYSGGCREFHVSDCRAQTTGGWGFNWSNSSDGFIWGCSVQGAAGGGYLVGGGNSKVFGNKVYSTGAPGAPAPGFRVSSSRCTLSGNEAQDCYGNGYEISGADCSVSGCTADSTGTGKDPGTSAGFLVSATRAMVTGKSYMRVNGGCQWIVQGAGQMYALRTTGADRQYIRLVSGAAVETWRGDISGTPASDSDVVVI